MTDTGRSTDVTLDHLLDAELDVKPSPALVARVRSRIAGETMRASWQMYGSERRTTMGMMTRNGIKLAYESGMCILRYSPIIAPSGPTTAALL
jgi:hypothetical protein